MYKLNCKWVYYLMMKEQINFLITKIMNSKLISIVISYFLKERNAKTKPFYDYEPTQNIWGKQAYENK